MMPTAPFKSREIFALTLAVTALDAGGWHVRLLFESAGVSSKRDFLNRFDPIAWLQLIRVFGTGT